LGGPRYFCSSKKEKNRSFAAVKKETQKLWQVLLRCAKTRRVALGTIIAETVLRFRFGDSCFGTAFIQMMITPKVTAVSCALC
jgi:hypothetical protein